MSLSTEYFPFLKWHQGAVFWSSFGVTIFLLILAAVIAIRGERAAEREGAKKRMIPLVGMILFGIGFIGCASWYFWPIDTKNGNARAHVAQPPSLLTLFMTDFRSHITGTKTNYTTNIEIEEHGVVRNVPIYSNLFYDFTTRTKFIAIYIEPSPDFPDLSKFLPEAIPGFFEQDEREHGGDFMGQGDSTAERRKELPFSGRVYLYYPAILDIQQLADLTKVFRDKNMVLQIRGPEYALAVWQNIESGGIAAPTPHLKYAIMLQGQFVIELPCPGLRCQNGFQVEVWVNFR